jgi:Predicted transcriptional regulators
MEDKCRCYPPENVAEDLKKYLDSELMYDLADFFKLFGDSTRVRILTALDKQEMCVCTLSDLLGMSMSAVSHQLRSLKQTKLVRSRKEGKNVYYALDDNHVKDVLEKAIEHITE